MPITVDLIWKWRGWMDDSKQVEGVLGSSSLPPSIVSASSLSPEMVGWMLHGRYQELLNNGGGSVTRHGFKSW